MNHTELQKIFVNIFKINLDQSDIICEGLPDNSCLFITIAGALSSYPIKRIGCDRTIFIAGLISSIGTFINVFADNIYTIFIFLGFVTGNHFYSLNIFTYKQKLLKCGQ